MWSVKHTVLLLFFELHPSPYDNNVSASTQHISIDIGFFISSLYRPRIHPIILTLDLSLLPRKNILFISVCDMIDVLCIILTLALHKKNQIIKNTTGSVITTDTHRYHEMNL